MVTSGCLNVNVGVQSICDRQSKRPVLRRPNLLGATAAARLRPSLACESAILGYVCYFSYPKILVRRKFCIIRGPFNCLALSIRHTDRVETSHLAPHRKTPYEPLSKDEQRGQKVDHHPARGLRAGRTNTNNPSGASNESSDFLSHLPYCDPSWRDPLP